VSLIVKVIENPDTGDLKHLDRAVVMHNETKTVYVKSPMTEHLRSMFGTKRKFYARASFKKGLFSLGPAVKPQDW
jgi:hypothetical protein